jgi:hypothetical protein
VGVSHFEVVAEHLVEPHLERSDSGALSLPLLQGGDVLPATVAQSAKLVELTIETGADHLPVGQQGRWPILESGGQLLGDVGQQVELIHCLKQGRCVGPTWQRDSGQRAQGLGHIGQPEKRIAESAELPWGGSPRGGPSREPLQVTHAIERFAQPPAAAAIPHRDLHRVEPLSDRGRIAQGREQPLPEQPTTHRGDRRVDGLEQRATPRSGAKRLDQLEVPAGHLIQPEESTAPTHAGPGEMGEPARLQLAEVAQQRAGRAKRGIIVAVDAQAIERRETEAPSQLLPGELGVELPFLPRSEQRLHDISGRGEVAPAGSDDLGGLES